MKAYLVRKNENNFVVITEKGIAKIFNCAPDGKFEEIDLYEDESEIKLQEHFNKVLEDDPLFYFSDIIGDDEMDSKQLFDDLEEDSRVILVYADVEV